MEINYIILDHKNPGQINRLINQLNGKNINFYIHIDRTVTLPPFKEQIEEKRNIYFLNDEQRKPGTWGDIGIVEGTMNAITEIIKHDRRGYCILLSGQDYPLKSRKTLEEFLEKKKGTHFIDTFELPGKSKEMATDRLNRYKINKSLKRGHFTLLPSIFDKDFYKTETLGKINYLRKSGRKKEILKIFKKREFPSYLTAFGGSAYWALPVETIKNINAFIKQYPDYLLYHKSTLCADEIFFHSIIMHLHKKVNFKIEPSLTYANWERKGGPKPVTFVASDIDELRKVSGEKFFARKFDADKDRLILDLIDRSRT